MVVDVLFDDATCTNLLAANKLFFLVAHVVVPFECTAADIPAVLLPP